VHINLVKSFGTGQFMRPPMKFEPMTATKLLRQTHQSSEPL